MLLRILDLCGGSGAWSKPYADAGYDVLIIDPVADGRDVRLLQAKQGRIHGILAAPPCTVWSYARNRYPPTEAEILESLSAVDACHRIVLGAASSVVGARESAEQAAPVSGTAALGVLPMGVWRSRPQADVHLGRFRAAEEAAQAADEAEHVAHIERERAARGRDHTAGICAGVLCR